MSDLPLTAKQAALLLYCGEFLAQNDQLPTAAAIAARFGWASPTSSWEMLKALRRKGYLARNALGKYRLTDKARAFITAKDDAVAVSDER